MWHYPYHERYTKSPEKLETMKRMLTRPVQQARTRTAEILFRLTVAICRATLSALRLRLMVMTVNVRKIRALPAEMESQ